MVDVNFSFSSPTFALENLKKIEFVRKWKRAGDALHGNGGYNTGAYLDRFKRETDDNYDLRKKTARNTSTINKKVSRYIGYLLKEQPVRTTSNELLQLFINNCDGIGNSLNLFISNFAKDAKIRGAGVCVLNMPSVDSNANIIEQVEKRLVPTITYHPPELIANFEKDNYIAFWESVDGDLVKHWYTTTTEYLTNRNDELIPKSEIVHNLGILPCVVFGENGQFPSVGEFTQLGDLAIERYNLKSELKLILSDQTFSLLTVEKKQGVDSDLEIGTSNALFYADGANPPSFIAPDAKQAGVYMDEIANIDAIINDITYDLTYTSGVESGIALDIKFQGLNSSLANFAQRLQEFEYRVFKIVNAMLGYGANVNNIEIEYNTDFNITDVQSEIRELDDLKTLGYSIPTYEKEKLKRIVAKSINSDDETLATIFDEINSAVQGVDDVSL